ncbi:TonB-dependent receptor [Silvimonas amylolytica]|uniref:Iron transport outer membrane receptor n=1 Tax=Silvimonas amylolytica TaxID=449663 RepID=A0ABQ2PLD7_9NEIS|nr:TonB-dependent siderophore receptor [Silvimonas amylolytica]GGP26040.1 iron transport outer membrane receptor [Silvimonas amylolytica]
MHQARKPIAALVAAAFTASVAYADDIATKPAAAEQTLQSVNVNATADRDETRTDYNGNVSTIGGKVPTAVRDIPQTVTVVNRAVMDAQGVSSLTDALRNVPGITIGGAEGGQIGNNINLRGFSARTDIYLDGVRDRGQYYRDTFYLDQVEVLKGPSSMMFGRGSTGGVINQVSKKPQLAPVGEVDVTIGTDDRYRATFDTGHAINDHAAWRIEGMAQDQHSSRDVISNQDVGLAPSVTFGIGDPTTITLSALLEHNHDMPDYGVPSVNGRPANVDKSNFYGLTDDRTNQTVATVRADIEHKINENLTLRNNTQYSHYETDARETALSTVLTPSGAALDRTKGNPTTLPLSSLRVQLASHDRDITDESIYNQTDLIWKTNTGSIKHTVLAGAEIGYDKYENQAYTRNNLPIVDMLDPAHLSSPANSVSTKGNYAESSANSLAFYANDTLEFTPEWKAVAGVRWDRFDGDITNSTSAPLSASNDTTFTSVRGGLIYQPTDSQSYYVSYGTSFNPSLEALTLTSGTQNLDPEKNRSYEVGGKWDFFSGNLSINSALFRIDKTNARTQDSSTGLYTLDGDTRVDGFELGAAGRITKQWQIFAGYTFLDGTVESAKDGTQGKTLANTPKNTATLWTTYSVTHDWEVGGGVLAMSNRYAANNNIVNVPGYARWDATVAYHQKTYDVRLNLLNLTDKYYYDSVIASDGGRATPGIARTALLTLSYHP